MINTVSSNSVAPTVLSSVRCLLLLGMQLAAMQHDAKRKDHDWKRILDLYSVASAANAMKPAAIRLI